MAFECTNHPGADAAWMCVGCEHVFCPDCIVEKKFGRTSVETCKACGELCKPVMGGIAVAEVGLAEEFGSAFVYPLRESGPLILLGGTLVACLLQFFASGYGALMSLGMFLAYGMLIIQTTADGSNKAPQWPDIATVGEIARPVLLACATSFVSFAPAGWAAARDLELLSWGLLLAGALYAPMAWIAASVSGNFLAITPITVLPLIFKVNSSYWSACAVLLPIAFLGQLGMGALDAIAHPLVSVPVVTAAFFYLVMVEMRILGLVWYHNRDELGLS